MMNAISVDIKRLLLTADARAALHHNSPSCFPGLVRLLLEGGQGAAKHFDPVMTSIMSVPEELEKRENN